MLNKSEIKNWAWELVRKANVAKFGLRRILRTAWNEAKYTVAAAKRAALAALPRTEADNIRETILVLECKDRWTDSDRTRHTALYQKLRAT